jgi:uncharacterized membrane protein
MRRGHRQTIVAIAQDNWCGAINCFRLFIEPILQHQPGSLIVAKSAAFGVLHLCIAFGVSYALTGSVAIAGAITLVEPLVNTVAHYFFDRWWGHPKAVAALRAARLKFGHPVPRRSVA